MYPNLVERYRGESHFQNHCILAPLNTNVDELNSRTLAMLLNSSQTYMSSDTFLPTNIDYVINDINPPEILHGMNFLGFLNHAIQLKVGASIVLLRNLDPSIGFM